MSSNQGFSEPERIPFLEQAFQGEALAPRYKSHLPRELIGAYAAGELKEPEMLDVAAHLNSCARCLSELNALRAAWERLMDRLSTVLPEPDQLFEVAQKRELARQAKGFFSVHQPNALEFLDQIWELLSAKPLREIARARPQLVRGELSGGRTSVAVLALLATILEAEHARRLSEISTAHLQELIERYAAECGLSPEWSQRLAAYFSSNR